MGESPGAASVEGESVTTELSCADAADDDNNGDGDAEDEDEDDAVSCLGWSHHCLSSSVGLGSKDGEEGSPAEVAESTLLALALSTDADLLVGTARMASTVLLLSGGSASCLPPFFEPGFALLGSLGPLVSGFASGCAVYLLAVLAVGLASGLAALLLALSFSAGLTSAASAATSWSVAVLPCNKTMQVWVRLLMTS